ncbi:hypothetical protein TELCIR_17887, partial [Teladorsagia circumcincta]
YVQEHGLTVPLLRSLASPNYNLTNKKDDGTALRADDLRQLLCEANCFCKTNWMPYDVDKWDAPQGGCYYPAGYTNWAPGQPDYRVGSCAYMQQYAGF